MTISLALLALSALSGTSQTPTLPVTAAASIVASSESEKAAIDTAQRFLALSDRDDWAACWEETHQSFKLHNTVAWWTQASRGMRSQIGTPASRAFLTADFAPAPPNGFWTLRFKANYSKKGSAVETLTLGWENGRWRVTSIIID